MPTTPQEPTPFSYGQCGCWVNWLLAALGLGLVFPALGSVVFILGLVALRAILRLAAVIGGLTLAVICIVAGIEILSEPHIGDNAFAGVLFFPWTGFDVWLAVLGPRGGNEDMKTDTNTSSASSVPPDGVMQQGHGQDGSSDIEVADAKQRVDELLDKAAQCIIPDDEFDELFGVCCGLERILAEQEYATLTNRLDLAVNSYCHILRIGRGLQDVTVELETAMRLNARVDSLEALTDEDIRLIGKRGADAKADEALFIAFLGLLRAMQGKPLPQTTASVRVVSVEWYTPLSGEQFEILAQSVFEQAVVCSTVNVTDKGNLGRWATESPALHTRLQLAFMLGIHNEQYRGILPTPTLPAAQRKAEANFIEDICLRAQGPGNLSPEECGFLLRHQPTSKQLKDKMSAAAPLGSPNLLSIPEKAAKAPRR